MGDGTFWACSNIVAGTWNIELAYERGAAIGNEALYDGYNGWYGPTANLNRSPFGGRNNIYFSEDALLTGKVSANTIRGAQSRGLMTYVKHFAVNEQETNRLGLATWLTEQALRENYLKAFEYTVKEGGTLGIMQSMNRVGGVNCFGNYALDVTVLRNEWNFKGAVITDAYSSSLVRENMAQRMGCDFPLGSWQTEIAGDWNASKNTVTYEGADSPTQWYVIRNASMHVLYMACNTSLMQNGYNSYAVTAKSVDEVALALNRTAEPVDCSIDTQKFGTDNVVYSADGLPAGLSIDPGTGVVSGTPTEAGEFDVTVTVTVADEGETWIRNSYSFNLRVAGDEEPHDENGLNGIGIAIVVSVISIVVIAAAAVAIILVKKKNNCK